MKRVYWLLATVSTMMLAISCGKNDQLDLDAKSIWKCYFNQNYDSAKLARDLIGTWKLNLQACYETGKTIETQNDVQVAFTSPTEFSVTEDGIILAQGTWKLKNYDGELMGLELSQTSTYTHGRILICDNQLLLENSFVDGCDNKFQRIK